MERVYCDLCGADNAEPIYSCRDWKEALPDGIALVRCKQCGLMYLNPRPSQQEIGEYYPDSYLAFRPAIDDERFALMRWVRRRKLIERRKLVEHYSKRKSGSILDVGSATGLFLHEMARAGWRVEGVEPIRSAAEYAKRRLGLDIFQGTLDQAHFQPGSFDAITFWDVLEHTYSPTRTLTQAFELLRPNGLLAINIPNWHSYERYLFGPYWSGFDPPRHLYVFTRKTMATLFEKTGFCPLASICFMPAYFSFIISIDRWLCATRPQWARIVSRVLKLPGTRFVFEPCFTVSNWLKISGLITLVARKRDNRSLIR